MQSELLSAAKQLDDWFRSILHVSDETLFGMAPEGPHRDAVVLDALRRNARILSQSDLDDEGKLYSPLCFFLAAACRKLGASLGVGHWRAALENVIHLQQRLVSARAESAIVGLETGSPVVLFKQELNEAINQAAIVGGAGYLDREDRQVALGLAINWGMRLLLAYASGYTRPATDAGRKDLAWLAGLMGPLLAPSSRSQ
jgi:hypothetical protein